MPKVQKEKTRARIHPYKNEHSKDMDIDDEVDVAVNMEEGRVEEGTRGAIAQRHKREWTALRHKIRQMKMQKYVYSHISGIKIPNPLLFCLSLQLSFLFCHHQTAHQNTHTRRQK
jgi:hypothetical protein